MGLVKNLLESKGRDVHKIDANATVFSALEELAKYDIGALVVTDKQNEIVGIFSERDYARKVILKGKSSKKARVKEMMTANVHYIKPDNLLRECLELMTKKRTRHLPVKDVGKVVGIVSIGDIVNRMIEEQKTKINYLENYIVGSDYGSEIKVST
ncbi:MAG: CBS domain-containing protein [Cytophagales bacterium]|nr:CBS domain-containing protein [Cytophagales bacterium]